jgi:hypothetical protein
VAACCTSANTTAKRGIIAEKDAFENQKQAEESYAQPNVITWARNGSVANGKIIPKPGQGDPSTYIKLLEFAIASIRDVTASTSNCSFAKREPTGHPRSSAQVGSWGRSRPSAASVALATGRPKPRPLQRRFSRRSSTRSVASARAEAGTAFYHPELLL